MHRIARLLLFAGLGWGLTTGGRTEDSAVRILPGKVAATKVGEDYFQKVFPPVAGLKVEDIPGELARLDRLAAQPGVERDILRARVVTQWAAHDPAAAMAYAQGRPKGLMRQMMVDSVTTRWVKSDLAALQAWALGAPNEDDFDGAVRRVVQALVERDPAGAARLAETTKPTAPTTHVEPDRWWRYTFREWARRAPKEAIDYASQLPKSDRRSSALLTVLSEWLNQDAAVSWAWLRTSPALSDDLISRTVFSRLAERDPAVATDAVVGLEEPLQSVAARQVGSTLALKNLQTALALAGRLPDKDARQVVLGTVAERLLYSGRPFEAAEFTLKMAPSATRDNLFRLIAIKKVSEDPREAIEWVQKLPPGKGRNEALGQAIEIWAEKDPRAAADFFLTVPVADRVRHWSELEIARSFARRDPAGALAWVKKLPPGDLEKPLVGIVVQEWTRADPAAARKFATAERDAERRDYYLAQVARGLKSKDPAEALRLAEQLPPGRLQEETLAELQRPPPPSPGGIKNR